MTGAPVCPVCGDHALEDADEVIPEGETVPEDWFCNITGHLWYDEGDSLRRVDS